MNSDYELVTNPYIIQNIRTQRYNAQKWSPVEKILKNRPKHVKDFFKKRQVPFHLLCETKFKRSLFGLFLHTYNKNEVQDYFMNDNKLAMLDYDLKTYNDNELENLERNNNFAPDLRKLLEKAVDEQDVIDYDFLYDNIYALRFCDTPLTFIDSELLKFRRLKVLILCGNWLTDIPGCYLPKSLEYIELFANQIQYVHNFTSKGPKRLIHIGMRRNWLTNDSKLHLLGNNTKFHYLQSLDLSENDIYELDDLLQGLQDLEQLMCLQLQGNPCSVVNCYKDEVLRYIPWLGQLDLTEILDKDRSILKEKLNQIDATIVFTCHRIMGLPKPIKDKGIEKWFYFSVGMPLLEDVVQVKNKKKVDNLKEVEVDTDNKSLKRVPSKKVNERSKEATKATKSVTASKKSVPSGPYDGPDEYEDECKRRVVDTTFKTERFAWDKIMQLPEEALLIKSAERNFADIRDTFRSSVCVKLIYLEVKPPEKLKKSTKIVNKKTKGMSNNSTGTLGMSNVQFEEPKETIVKKITLAEFYCDLHSINWSDKTIDFIWAQQKQFENGAQEVDGSLRCINYTEKKEVKPKESKTASDSSTFPDVKQPIPKVFTIQVGFGLKRTYYQS